MSRPVIGIATQTQEALPGELPPCWIMGHQYVNVIRQAGALPWLLPLIPDDVPTLRGIFDRLDGIFLTGGVDVDPARYGETREPFCGRSDPARDAVEIQLIQWAWQERKPILAICRGAQVLNVALGGSLYQDVNIQVPKCIKHDCFPTKTEPARDVIVHDVNVRSGTNLHGLLASSSVNVNSMHHQAVKRLALGLHISATAPDGIVEGVEGTNGQFVVGVQWHPEEMVEKDAGMRRMFASFISAAA
ncbi:MAG TPA: gamma-glutamyl-gamma-aminobutyrate hydrolase family protein [Gemmataceae bacterium]|nr:gamma-glutamyl-gamma-aminobutyrate hydrolase family protein [Gemmataceae bacterium]